MNNTLAYFTAKAAQIPDSQPTRLTRLAIGSGGTSTDRYVVAFGSGSSHELIWNVPSIPDAYQGGTLRIDVECVMASATSGNVVLTGEVESITAGDAVNLITTSNFSSPYSSGTVGVPGSAGRRFVVTVAMESCLDSDYVRIRLIRDTDTATGDLYVIGATLYEQISVVEVDAVKFAAGTTTVSPIQFVSGTNLTSPAAGVIDYDGSYLYWTNDALVRTQLGLQGPQGTHVNWYSAAGAPASNPLIAAPYSDYLSNLQQLGDKYLDTTTGDVHLSAGTWGAGWTLTGNIKADWYSAAGAPTSNPIIAAPYSNYLSTLQTAGDSYLDTTTGDVYLSAGTWGSGWTLTGNIKGVQGSQGFQGDQGNQGNQGFQGDVGTQGPQGNQGFQGDQGFQGATGADSVVPGPQGNQGFQGDQGTQGNQGFQGDQGTQGNQGFQGDQGTQGNQGFQGDQGTQGNQGFQGDQGTQGNQGFQGDQGTQGNQGFQGDQGTQGDSFSTGLTPFTKGDIFAATNSTTITKVGVGTDGLILTADSTQTPGIKWGSPMVSTTPTIQTFTSGSGTYTTPANCIYIRVRMVGGGGGGGGSGATNATDGGTGGNTTFGTSLLVANGGAGGSDVIASYGGAGGTASLGTGPIGIASTGGPGGGNNGAGVIGGPYSLGGHGASTPFGGGGGCAANGIGQAGTANTGSGGGGGSPANGQANVFSGSGGGAGGYVDAMIINPSATYSYAVGTGGTAGAAGTNGNAGGAGGSGHIVVEQYFAVATLPYVAPTIQTFTSGSGTYTTPTNCLYIRVRMVGGGGGGGGSGTTSNPSGGNGGATTFGTSLLTCNGGIGGVWLAPGTGGTASLGSGPIGVASTGNGTTSGILSVNSYQAGVPGAASPFGGSGAGNVNGLGGSAYANTGSGGAGGGTNNTGTYWTGSGGGSGGYIDAIIVNPSATYSYAVGSGGTAGSAGTSGYTGGAGGSGYIIVEQYFAPASAQDYVTPTVTKLTTGSGTYNTPAGCAFIKVKMVGAGGGGSGSGTAGQGSGGAGGNTTFGSSLLVANGGSGGLNTTAGGAGGTASLGTGPIGVAVTGTTGAGTPAVSYGTYGMGGGRGGDSPYFGGSGNPVYQAAGGAGVTNTGGGGAGGGAGSTNTSVGGSGGGSGGFVDAIITTPAASYSYSIGAAGTAGTAGTSGFAGGAGGSGYIVVEEYCTQASGTYATLTGVETFTNKTISYAAGTTTANTAPIKLLSGTNMTTPESGAIEFDGTDLYITNSTPTRNKVGIKKAPTVQKFTSSSGTYTTPTGCVWIRVRMVGGGGGGSGGGATQPSGGAGGNTTFGTTLLVANGGSGSSGAYGGLGGSASLGSGPIGLNLSGGTGGNGGANSGAACYAKGGNGAASAFGGSGTGGIASAGGVGSTNTGAGGGGGSGNNTATHNGGGGGGAGGFVDAIINSPSATYSYAVGSAGSAGSAGTSGSAGAAGAAGIIIVEEYYS